MLLWIWKVALSKGPYIHSPLIHIYMSNEQGDRIRLLKNAQNVAQHIFLLKLGNTSRWKNEAQKFGLVL
jgi:hypothetical protein